MFIVYSSVASELDVYTELKEKFQGFDFDSEYSMEKPLYHVFINCKTKLWVEGCIFHGCNELLDIIPGFVQFTHIKLVLCCEDFTSKILKRFSDNVDRIYITVKQ